jgi:electron transport complex protein RnfC
MAFSFRNRTRGGVRPPGSKNQTQEKSIREIQASPTVFIPLQQHVGALCAAEVKKGDRVGVGTRIADSEAYVSSPIHSSVSGKVVRIAPHVHPALGDVLTAIIENDGEDARDPEIRAPGDWLEMDADELRRRIRDAGIVGMGGAAFPTHVKLDPPRDFPIDTVILNGVECEPYLTADYRLMLEDPESIVEGLRIIMRVVGAAIGIIAIEDNKPKAIEKMREVASGSGLRVESVKTRYPQGAEKILIKSVLGRRVPQGGLPMHVGVVVNNVGTAHAIAQYFSTGMPLVKRVVTVAGSPLEDPSNLLVPLGTTFAHVIEACGGFREEPGKVIMGGPMMGVAQYTLEAPVIKATSGILALSPAEVGYSVPTQPVCIRCGRCVDTCPMGLNPSYLAAYAYHQKWDQLERLRINDCMECGCCSYGCPTKNPIVQLVKMGKIELARRKEHRERTEKELEAIREPGKPEERPSSASDRDRGGDLAGV